MFPFKWHTIRAQIRTASATDVWVKFFMDGGEITTQYGRNYVNSAFYLVSRLIVYIFSNILTRPSRSLTCKWRARQVLLVPVLERRSRSAMSRSPTTTLESGHTFERASEICCLHLLLIIVHMNQESLDPIIYTSTYAFRRHIGTACALPRRHTCSGLRNVSDASAALVQMCLNDSSVSKVDPCHNYDRWVDEFQALQCYHCHSRPWHQPNPTDHSIDVLRKSTPGVNGSLYFQTPTHAWQKARFMMTAQIMIGVATQVHNRQYTS